MTTTPLNLSTIFPALDDTIAARQAEKDAAAAEAARKQQEQDDAQYAKNLAVVTPLIVSIGGDPANLTRIERTAVLYKTPALEVEFSDFFYNEWDTHKKTFRVRIAVAHALNLSSEDIAIIRDIGRRNWQWDTNSVVTTRVDNVTAVNFAATLKELIDTVQTVIPHVPRELENYRRQQSERAALRAQTERERAEREALELSEKRGHWRKLIPQDIAAVTELGGDASALAERLAAIPAEDSPENDLVLEALYLAALGARRDAEHAKRERDLKAVQEAKNQAIADLLGCAPELVRYIREIVRSELNISYEYEED